MLGRTYAIALVGLIACSPPEGTTSPNSAAVAEPVSPADEGTDEPEPSSQPAAQPELTIMGEWVGDATCVSEMSGMEGADEATVELVGQQIEQNRFVFSDETLTHHVAATSAEEPYEIVSREGPNWTIKMKGPNGDPQVTELEIKESTIRMSRDGALVMCLRRP